MEKIHKSDEEWRKELSPEEYHILREKGTEPAFSGEYWDNHDRGAYKCRACGLEIFSSEDKFDSRTGWPSFTRPIKEDSIETAKDEHYGLHRTEVKCNVCGSHLGHVFDDGPRPTGKRYCINSLALKFEKNAAHN